MLRNRMILMDAASGDGSPSGNGTPATPPSTPQFTTPQTAGNVDPASTVTPPAQTPPEEQTPEANKEPEQVATPEPTKIEVDLKGLKDEDVADLVTFAEVHKLTKEQAQALVDTRKAEHDAIANSQKEMVEKRAAVHSKWETELKADKDFGGQNYDQNIHVNEKFIGEHMPALGKLLTDNGQKLPPMIMKELNSVARKLYSESEFVQGAGGSHKSNNHHPTDYYGKEQNGK